MADVIAKVAITFAKESTSLLNYEKCLGIVIAWHETLRVADANGSKADMYPQVSEMSHENW